MIILLGDSHVGCLMRAAAQRPKMDTVRIGGLGAGSQLVHKFFTRHDDHISFTLPHSRNRLHHMTGKQAIWRGDQFLFGFSLGFFAFRVCQNHNWRRFAPAGHAKKFGKKPLSDAVVDAIIMDDTKDQRAFFTALKDLDIPFFALSAPPLQRHLPVLKRGANQDVILHMESRYHQLMAAFFSDLGVDVIMPPNNARAEDGFLRTEFEIGLPGDIRHANEAYGHLMLDKILDHLQVHHADRLQPKLIA